jgi:hypothetical protein
MRPTYLDLLLLVLFALLMAGVTWAMFAARERTLAQFAGPESRQQWDEWREAVREGKADMGMVKRQQSRSPEPPTLVLLRDHFITSLAGLLAISAVLYASIALSLRGVLSSSHANATRPLEQDNDEMTNEMTQ